TYVLNEWIQTGMGAIHQLPGSQQRRIFAIEVRVLIESPDTAQDHHRRHPVIEKVVVRGVQVGLLSEHMLVSSVEIGVLEKHDMPAYRRSMRSRVRRNRLKRGHVIVADSNSRHIGV